MAASTRLSTGNGFPNVVVTGFAMTTALATDAETTWQRLLDGQSGIRLLDDPFVEQYNLPSQTSHDLLLCAMYYRAFIADRVEALPEPPRLRGPRQRPEKAVR